MPDAEKDMQARDVASATNDDAGASAPIDEEFDAEQAHLTEVYEKLVAMRSGLYDQLEGSERSAAQDLLDMSEEIRMNFGSADETMETLAAIETLNSVIDAYNQHHDYMLDKLRRVLLLLIQPYFAKVRLKMPSGTTRDVYIGAAGVTDKDSRPLIVDWRSPVAETYYNQQMGETSYLVNGKRRTATLELRRQYDISQNILKSYFDTTVAIQDSLLLSALKHSHTEKLRNITATIQREQNKVVRHADVPALLVAGIAGSGKTSVMLQRIAYLLFNERETLSPDQVWLFSPNEMFGRYIDNVLPSMGESNPRLLTWRDFIASQGLADRNIGTSTTPETLRELEAAVPRLSLEARDIREIAIDGVRLLKAGQIKTSLAKFAKIPMGPRFVALVTDELHDKLDRRIAQLAGDDELQEEMLSLDVDQQLEVFGQMINPLDDQETLAYAKTYSEWRFSRAHEMVSSLAWLRLDRIATSLLGRSADAAEALWLRLLIAGPGCKDARYVMIDEVQDYPEAHLMVLARFFSRAHFLLLGDEHQAIFEGTASFDQVRRVFGESHGSVDECQLLTSYRSSPEITAIFMGLLEKGEEALVTVSSVREAGVAPEIVCHRETDAYLAELGRLVEDAREADELCAVICADRDRTSWLAKKLGDGVMTLRKDSSLPARGVVLTDVALAKGLEFDHVIIADAQRGAYPDTPLARRRLYTAVSRAMHKVTFVSQGELSPLLAPLV